MARHTITIDTEAYEILLRARCSNESFSAVIKGAFEPTRSTATGLLGSLAEHTVSYDMLDEMDRVVAARAGNIVVDP